MPRRVSERIITETHGHQSLRQIFRTEMELFISALMFALLTTASANPAGLREHQDADLSDGDLNQGWMEWMESHYTAVKSSSESQSSEELSSSEETLLTAAPSTDGPLPDTPATTGLPIAMTTEGLVTPGTLGTDLPIVDNTTVLEQSTSMPCGSTGCVTVEIPTDAPVTDNRGDN